MYKSFFDNIFLGKSEDQRVYHNQFMADDNSFELTLNIVKAVVNPHTFDYTFSIDLTIYVFIKDHRDNKAFDKLFCGSSIMRISVDYNYKDKVTAYNDNSDLYQNVQNLLVKNKDCYEFKNILDIVISKKVPMERFNHKDLNWDRYSFVSCTASPYNSLVLSDFPDICPVTYKNNRFVYSEIEKHIIETSTGTAKLEYKPKRARVL